MSAVLEEVTNDLQDRHLNCAVPVTCKVCMLSESDFLSDTMRLWHAAASLYCLRTSIWCYIEANQSMSPWLVSVAAGE